MKLSSCFLHYIDFGKSFFSWLGWRWASARHLHGMQLLQPWLVAMVKLHATWNLKRHAGVSLLCALCMLLSLVWLICLSCAPLQRVIAEAHQHVTSELVIRLIDDFHATLSQSDFADTSNQGSTLPDAMEVTTDPSTETMSSQQLAHQPQNNAAERLGKRRLSSEQVSASSRKRGRCSASAASEHEPS